MNLSRLLARLLWIAAACSLHGADDVYQKPSDFIKEVFGGEIPKAGAVTLDDSDQERIKGFMGHPYESGQVRYWGDDERTVWILNAIGKTKPITTGYVVSKGRIERVKVLIYRESHGWEVRQPFFTRQFKDASLGEDNKLDRRIDNIAGATLSARALTDMAQLALLLEQKRLEE